MSFQDGNSQVAEVTIPELELNKETLQDLEVDGSQVKGGGAAYAVAGPAPVNPGAIRISGPSVILPGGG